MPTLYLVRHAESQANAQHILASHLDFALSDQGHRDAAAIAQNFLNDYAIEAIVCSPLLRARQTAAPFEQRSGLTAEIDQRICEQHLGRFAGMSYAQAESDPGYCVDRTARWEWVPEGGGESYRMISLRVTSFLQDMEKRQESAILIVTHAVTLRLFKAVLENTLPQYPEKIAGNGEIGRCQLVRVGQAAAVETLIMDGVKFHRE